MLTSLRVRCSFGLLNCISYFWGTNLTPKASTPKLHNSQIQIKKKKQEQRCLETAEKGNWNRMWHFPWSVTDGPHTTCLKIPTPAPISIISHDDASGHLEYGGIQQALHLGIEGKALPQAKLCSLWLRD